MSELPLFQQGCTMGWTAGRATCLDFSIKMKFSCGSFTMLNLDLNPSSVPPKQHLILYGRGAGAGMVHPGDSSVFWGVNGYFVGYTQVSYLVFALMVFCIQELIPPYRFREFICFGSTPLCAEKTTNPLTATRSTNHTASINITPTDNL